MDGYLAALGGVAQAMAATAPAISMLAIFALIFGGIYLWVKRGERQKAALMLVLAVVIFANVVIWTL
ncbi:MAG: hypothetical protein JWN66_1929 [Sphingomonas bacterium]|jgi:hypothetical protein|uniref:hypothetical protein n=1 Tax=Sphingomonas bacterium TaxID=1895847 RepID=UPI0026118209|nr:hypothetical protein [Sphingomonas bacterium]MDB5704813.1 hypothetical protein [Sphingomonas bacterium]